MTEEIIFKTQNECKDYIDEHNLNCFAMPVFDKSGLYMNLTGWKPEEYIYFYPGGVKK